MYTKKFTIRWADLDANGHLAHSSYQKLTADARLSLFLESGVNISILIKENIGSVIFYEEIYFFKEFLFADQAYVKVELIGLSCDFKFFKFRHNIYQKDGTHAYTSKILGSWMNLELRKLSPPPRKIIQIFENLEKEKDFEIIINPRINGIKPQNIEPFLRK